MIPIASSRPCFGISARVLVVQVVAALSASCTTPNRDLENPAAPRSAAQAYLDSADAERIRRDFLQAATQTLSPPLANALDEHLRRWMKRLSDREVLEIANASARNEGGPALLATAQTDVERTYADVFGSGQSGDGPRGHQAAMRLLSLLGQDPESVARRDAVLQTAKETAANAKVGLSREASDDLWARLFAEDRDAFETSAEFDARHPDVEPNSVYYFEAPLARYEFDPDAGRMAVTEHIPRDPYGRQVFLAAMAVSPPSSMERDRAYYLDIENADEFKSATSVGWDERWLGSNLQFDFPISRDDARAMAARDPRQSSGGTVRFPLRLVLGVTFRGRAGTRKETNRVDEFHAFVSLRSVAVFDTTTGSCLVAHAMLP